MVRVSVYYDKEEKEQFFMVRGDERYARATTMLLELGNPTESTLNFNLPVTVNVLRDVGEANIVIYDNDSPIHVITDWNSENNGMTIVLNNLNYDITHNFYAIYMGNDKCSQSKSKTISYTLQNTHIGTTTLTIDDGSLQFDPNSQNITKLITITNTLDEAYNHNQNISVYYDNVLVNTLSTGMGDTVTVTLPTLQEGLHTIKAVYSGNEHLSPRTVTQDISVGYKVTPVSYPSLIFNTQNCNFLVKINNYLNNPVPNMNVGLLTHNSVTSNGESQETGITNSSGEVQFYTNKVKKEFISFKAEKNGHSYSSNILNIPFIIPESLTISSANPRLYKNEDNLIRFITDGMHHVNIPLEVWDNGEHEVIYTDINGSATKTITGIGKGTHTIQVKYGRGTNFLQRGLQLDDYNQYWEPPSNLHNQIYYLGTRTIYNLNNYFRIPVEAGTPHYSQGVGSAPVLISITPSLQFFSIYNITDEDDYELIITGLSSSKECTVRYVHDAQYNGSLMVENLNTNLNNAPHSNETWKIVRTNGTVTVYRNEIEIESYTNQEGKHPTFIIINNTTSSININFTKLTLKGGVE